MKGDKTQKVSSVGKTERVRKYRNESFRDKLDLNNNGYKKNKEFREALDLANKKYEENDETSKKDENEKGSRSEKVDLKEIKREMEGKNIGQIHKLTSKLENNSLEQGIEYLKYKKTKKAIEEYEKRTKDNNEQR